MGKVVAPFRRNLKLGSRGTDVKAIKRAAQRLGGFRTGPRISPIYGPLIWTWMRRWKKKHGLPARDGSYGIGAHRSFVRHNAFDAYGAWLLKSADWTTVDEKRRDAIVRTALYAASRAYLIHYTQGAGRMSGVRGKIMPPNVPPFEDCSSFVTWCYWVANHDVGGVPDPNGLNYSGYGFTGTLKTHGRRVTNPRPGDLALYGGGVGHHVLICIGRGRGVSHGKESDPQIVDIAAYNRARGDFSEYRDYIGG